MNLPLLSALAPTTEPATNLPAIEGLPTAQRDGGVTSLFEGLIAAHLQPDGEAETDSTSAAEPQEIAETNSDATILAFAPLPVAIEVIEPTPPVASDPPIEEQSITVVSADDLTRPPFTDETPYEASNDSQSSPAPPGEYLVESAPVGTSPDRLVAESDERPGKWQHPLGNPTRQRGIPRIEKTVDPSLTRRVTVEPSALPHSDDKLETPVPQGSPPVSVERREVIAPITQAQAHQPNSLPQGFEKSLQKPLPAGDPPAQLEIVPPKLPVVETPAEPQSVQHVPSTTVPSPIVGAEKVIPLPPVPLAQLPVELPRVVLTHRQLIADTGEVEFRFDIDPPDLGPVRVAVIREQSGWTARIGVTSGEAATALSQQWDALRDATAAQGIQLADVTVDPELFPPRQESPAQKSQSERQPPEQPDHSDRAANDDDRPQPVRYHLSRVNLRA